MSAPAQSAASSTVPARPGPLTLLNLACVALLLAAGIVNLWPQWRHNPDLSHGWFTPLIFALLVHEARTRATPRYLPARPATHALLGLALAAGLTLLAAGGLYMAALDRTHTLVAVVLTAALCTLLGAAWIGFSTANVRLVPFAWPVAVAIFLWLLSAPLPPGMYARLTQGLQLWITDTVLAVLHLLGIAAMKHGNVIELPNATVGVEEACSGVRSLISCVYAGFFFSASMARTFAARLTLIVLSAVLAIVMNLLRSLTLTLLASNGVDIAGAWHDVTGFAVLGVTAALLGALAWLLNRRDPGETAAPATKPSATPQDAPAPASPARSRLPLLALACGLAAALALVAFFTVNAWPRSGAAHAPPDLAALLPEQYPGWTVTSDGDLHRFSEQLQTDHLLQRTYGRETADGGLQITVYIAYWSVGQAPVSLVASHTPDACWPGAGWTSRPVGQPRVRLLVGGHPAPEAEQRLFDQSGFSQYVWFWHLYGGRNLQIGDEVRSPRHLLRLALRYGFRRDSEQVFFRISSNRPWDALAGEPLVKEIFARMEKFGL